MNDFKSKVIAIVEDAYDCGPWGRKASPRLDGIIAAIEALTSDTSTDLLALVRDYSDRIDNGRSVKDIFQHFETEVVELRTEMENGDIGVDGIVGEAVDGISCLLDLIYVHKPELTNLQIMGITTKKLNKWERIYGRSYQIDEKSAAFLSGHKAGYEALPTDEVADNPYVKSIISYAEFNAGYAVGLEDAIINKWAGIDPTPSLNRACAITS